MRISFAILSLFACSASFATEISIPDRFKESCSSLPGLVEKVEADLRNHFPSTNPVFDVVVKETDDDSGSRAYQAPEISHIVVSDKLCGTSRLESSLKHEMTHVMSRWSMGRERYIASPKWFREGLAVILSGQWESEITEDERKEARLTKDLPIPDDAPTFNDYTRSAARVEALIALNGSSVGLKIEDLPK